MCIFFSEMQKPLNQPSLEAGEHPSYISLMAFIVRATDNKSKD